MEKDKGNKSAALLTSSAPGKLVNYVHKQTIHRENIKNEKKIESKNFKHEYTFSPYSCI